MECVVQNDALSKDRFITAHMFLHMICCMTGEWVLRQHFAGRKSFARYRCRCGNKWMSAHGYPDVKQGCLECAKLATLPCCMWRNNGNGHVVGEPWKDDDTRLRRTSAERCGSLDTQASLGSSEGFDFMHTRFWDGSNPFFSTSS